MEPSSTFNFFKQVKETIQFSKIFKLVHVLNFTQIYYYHLNMRD